jgi:Response regulator receiver domain
MRNFLVRVLKPRCKRIEEAADVKEASRALDEQHFDVVILDNLMPGKRGLDWLAEQRAIGFFADVNPDDCLCRFGYRHRGSARWRGRLCFEALPIQPTA